MSISFKAPHSQKSGQVQPHVRTPKRKSVNKTPSVGSAPSSKKTKNQLMSWSHYKFKELLRYKMKIRGGKLLDCTEEYTSKTCSACGRLNHALKGSKTFACGFSDCKSEMDRDANAAKNIFIKNYKLLLD